MHTRFACQIEGGRSQRIQPATIYDKYITVFLQALTVVHFDAIGQPAFSKIYIPKHQTGVSSSGGRLDNQEEHQGV
jgi:hypothetical protein